MLLLMLFKHAPHFHRTFSCRETSSHVKGFFYALFLPSPLARKMRVEFALLVFILAIDFKLFLSNRIMMSFVNFMDRQYIPLKYGHIFCENVVLSTN